MKRNYLSILFVILGIFSVTVHAEQGAEKIPVEKGDVRSISIFE